jgi:hypothetical protein
MRVVSKKKNNQNEYNEQCHVFQWAAHHVVIYPHLAYLHSSLNGVKLSIGQAQKAKLGGMKKGVPDICLPFRALDYTQLFIEMKHGKNKPTPDQQQFMQFLIAGGAYVTTCYSALEAIDVIKKYVAHCRPFYRSDR